MKLWSWVTRSTRASRSALASGNSNSSPNRSCQIASAIAFTVKSRRTRSRSRSAGSTSGSAPGLGVRLGARRRDINRQRAVGRAEVRGQKARMLLDRAADPLGKQVGQFARVAFDHHVVVELRKSEHQVAHGAADEIRARSIRDGVEQLVRRREWLRRASVLTSGR